MERKAAHAPPNKAAPDKQAEKPSGVEAIVRLAEERLGVTVKGLTRTPESHEKEALLDEAMKNVEADSKAAYEKVRIDAPQLVMTESSPRKFIRVARESAPDAARRMAQYWEHRSRLFTDSPNKPLTITGDGSMGKSDIEVFNSGFFATLPPDSEGRPVVLYDRSRLEEDFDDVGSLQEHMLKCAFYILSIVAHEEIAQSKGIVFLEIIHKGFQPLPIDGIFRRELLHLIETALPLLLAHSHIVFKQPRADQADTNYSQLHDEAVQTIRASFPEGKFTIHNGSKKKQILLALEQNGFRKEGLPSSIGGKKSTINACVLDISPIALCQILDTLSSHLLRKLLRRLELFRTFCTVETRESCSGKTY